MLADHREVYPRCEDWPLCDHAAVESLPRRNSDGSITTMARPECAGGIAGDAVVTVRPGDGELYDNADAYLRAKGR